MADENEVIGVTIEGPEGSVSVEADARKLERKAVAQWQSAIEQSRDFDEHIREVWATNRSYAAGQSEELVSVNLIGSFIDVLSSFLVAQNPTPQAEPARTTDTIIAEEAKRFSETLEAVLSRLWHDGRLDQAALRCLRSALTLGIGWIKASWQDSSRTDPTAQTQLNDIQENLAKLRLQAEAITEGNDPDIEARIEAMVALSKTVEGQVERTVARGMVFDFVPAEDITVPEGLAEVSDYRNAPWMDHRLYMRPEDVAAQFGIDEAEAKKAATFFQRQPRRHNDLVGTVLESARAEDAEQFTESAGRQAGKESQQAFAAVHETWDKATGVVRVWAEGIDRWLKQPSPPKYASQRFYPFFQVGFLWVDGQRWPQSHVQRSWRLMDEYNRIRSAVTVHRRRSIPNVFIDGADLDATQVKKLEQGLTQEIIVLKFNRATANVGDFIKEKRYARLDPNLYDTSAIRSDLEAIWGVQEALAGTVQIAKTATEASIQQQGTQARTGIMRWHMDRMLSDLALYCAEVSVAALSPQEVGLIAGANMLWPRIAMPEDLNQLVRVKIEAGSTGRPGASSSQQAWAAMLPIIQNAVLQIGQLRQAPPSAIARGLEKVALETFRMVGLNVDARQFIPQETEPGNDTDIQLQIQTALQSLTGGTDGNPESGNPEPGGIDPGIIPGLDNRVL